MQTFYGAVATRRREMSQTAVLVVLDVLAMVAAFELGRLVRSRAARPFAHTMTHERFLALTLAAAPLWIVLFALCGLYRLQIQGGRVSEVFRAIAAVTVGVTLLTSMAYLDWKTPLFPSREVPLFALAFGIPLVVAERQVARAIRKRRFRKGKARAGVLIVGSGEFATRIAGALRNSASGYELSGHVWAGIDGVLAPDGVPVYPSLEAAVEQHPHVVEVIQTDAGIGRGDALRMMALANDKGISYRFVPDEWGMFAAASKLSGIDGIPVMSVRLTALDGWGALAKRVFDAVGAALLLIVFSPVILGVAVAVKAAEPTAPVFYRARRIGLRGQPIAVVKFRTMAWKYCTGPGRPFATAEDALRAMGREDLLAEFRVNQKLADDPRVSRLGGFLRRSSLDELPQLFDALTGRLSLVGPRPVTHAELERYGAQVSSFMALKPGITGLWQVYGRSNTTYEERVKMDIYYVENWTMSMDVSILARTLVSVAARKGAV